MQTQELGLPLPKLFFIHISEVAKWAESSGKCKFEQLHSEMELVIQKPFPISASSRGLARMFQQVLNHFQLLICHYTAVTLLDALVTAQTPVMTVEVYSVYEQNRI